MGNQINKIKQNIRLGDSLEKEKEMKSLNDYASTHIDQPVSHVVTISECKNDYTRSGKNAFS